MQQECEDLKKDEDKCISLLIHNGFLGQMNRTAALLGLKKEQC